MKIISNVGEPNVSRIYYLMAKKMAAWGHETLFATISGRIEQDFPREFPVVNVEREVNARLHELLDSPECAKLRKKYSREEVRKIYRMDYALRDTPEKHLQEKTLAYIALWLELLRKHEPDLIITLDASTLFDTTAFEAAKMTGTPMLFTNGESAIVVRKPDGSPQPTIYWDSTNMVNHWVDKSFLKRDPTPGEEKKIREYSEAIRSEKKVHGGKKPAIITLENAKKYASFIANYVFKEKFGAYHDPLKLAADKVGQIIRLRLAKKYYSKKPLDELLRQKFVFFAFQTPDDGQIVARAPQFANQHEWAIKCARSLPRGVKLFVKEHPHGTGSYPISWFKQLAAEPNIEVIPPAVNSHYLTQNGLCSIIINSTAGWEALLYCKPVVLLGRPFYSEAGVTFDVEEGGRDLEQKIYDAIMAGRVPEKKVFRLANAVFHSLWPCSFYAVVNNRKTYDLSDQNISLLARSCLETYQKIWGKPKWSKSPKTSATKNNK